MRERLSGRALVEKATQLFPTVAILPTHHEQIPINSSTKIFEHCSIVVLISPRRIVIVPLSRLHAMNLIPPVWLYPVRLSDSLALVMALQTSDVSRCIFPQRKNEFGIRKATIEFFVEQKPRPVFNR